MAKQYLDYDMMVRYNTALKGKVRRFLTQAEYDAIATKDPATIYFITDSQKIIRDGKEFGGIFNIHTLSSAPASDFGRIGDFAIVTDTTGSTYGDIYYKRNASVWTNITGARLDAINIFQMPQYITESSPLFGGSPEALTIKDSSGNDRLALVTDKVRLSSDGFTWFEIAFPNLSANDTFALEGLTQTKITFGTATPDATLGNDGDLYLQYTADFSMIKLHCKISGVWYAISGNTDSTFSDTSERPLQNKVVRNAFLHSYSDGTDLGIANMKSIRSGDTYPTTVTEGDIFLKHRGTDYDYLNTNDIINDLTTGGTNKVLSAEMGKSLQDNKINKSDIVTDVAIGGADKVASAQVTRWLLDDKVSWGYTGRGGSEAFICDNGSGLSSAWWGMWGHYLIFNVETDGSSFNVTSSDAFVRVGYFKNFPRAIQATSGTGMVYSVAESKFSGVFWSLNADNSLYFYRNTELGAVRYGRFYGMVWVP